MGLETATAANHFVCVQSIVADDAGSLWVVDPAAPLLASVVPGGAKVVQIDLATNKVVRVYAIGPDIARPDSYLNDIRIDTKRKTAYLTESGEGGIVILDLNTGRARRALDGHPSVKAQPGVQISVNGKRLIGPTGKPPQLIPTALLFLTTVNIFYQCVTGATLYRVKTGVLRDNGATPSQQAAAVETVAKTFPVDGLWMDSQDRIYLSNINESAVSRIDKDGRIEKIAADQRLERPDTFRRDPTEPYIYNVVAHQRRSAIQ